MKLAIMQPYFFPYLGYFDLLYNVDLFVVYDTVQYIKQGWINRNRILHPHREGWHYISAPVDRTSFHDSYKTPILDVKVRDDPSWKEHLVAQLAHYERTAPYGKEISGFVRDCLSVHQLFISQLNVHILEQCAKLLKFNFQYRFCSDLDIALNPESSAEQRVLELCCFLGATEYINLPGGIDLYDSKSFATRGIKLTFRDLHPFQYQTGPYVFEPNLSIIDVLMWNRQEDVINFLVEHRDKG